jgi:hypothetical protein
MATPPSTGAQPRGPIFIVGYIHTGTSLLHNILSRDGSLFASAGESHFFHDLKRIRDEFPNLDDPTVQRDYVYFLVMLAYLGARKAATQRDEFTLGELGLTAADFETVLAAARKTLAVAPAEQRHEALFSTVMDQLTAINGKRRWLEKTPAHVHFLGPILNQWPDARVVELVRDPRGALASRKHRRTEEWLDAKEEAEGAETDRTTNFDPLLDSMMWKEAVRAGDEAKLAHPGRVLTVRYEDMVSRPAEVIPQICDFVGLAYTDRLLEVGWVNSTSKSGSGSEGISTAAIEKWRKSLTPEEIHVCQVVLRQDMARYQYEPVPVSAAVRAKTPVLLAQSAGRLASRLGSRQTTGVEQRRSDTTRRMYRRVVRNLGLQK